MAENPSQIRCFTGDCILLAGGRYYTFVSDGSLCACNIDTMTLSSQLSSVSGSRKPSKKINGQQKTSTAKTTPPPKDDTKKNTDSKLKKPSGTNDRKNTLSPPQGSQLRRSSSIRKQLSNLVSSGASTLRRSLSFGRGLNERLPKKPWHSSLVSLREDVFSTDEGASVVIPDGTHSNSSVFDSRKPVTRSQSLLVQKTVTDNDASAKKYKVSCYYCLVSLR
jgi:hypothetical protein